MRTLEPFILLILGMSLVLAGCGGGGGGGGDDLDVGTGPGDPDPDPPADPLLDIELAPLLQDGGAAVPPPAVPHPAPLVTLGRALFFDKILSGNRNISCASCHHPNAGTGDDLSVSFGEGGTGTAPNRTLADGALIPRNAPQLWDLGRQRFMFWDGRVERRPDGTFLTPEPALNGPNPAAAEIVAVLPNALSAQALFPPTSREEMRGQPGENEIADAGTNLEIWQALMARLVGTQGGTVGGIEEYRLLFGSAFPGVQTVDDFNFGHVGAAIGAFIETSFRTSNSPYQRYLGGETTAMSDDAKRGAILFFGRADCARCHSGPELSDNRFHSIGVPQVGPGRDAPLEDVGRFSVNGNPNSMYDFKTPALTNVAVNGPYMHDGAYTTLENALRHYINPLQRLNNYDLTQLDPILQGLVDTNPTRQAARAQAIDGPVRGGVNLNDTEVQQMLRFLEALTDDDAIAFAQALIPVSVPSGLPVSD